jgi:hypothetical protein
MLKIAEQSNIHGEMKPCKFMNAIVHFRNCCLILFKTEGACMCSCTCTKETCIFTLFCCFDMFLFLRENHQLLLYFDNKGKGTYLSLNKNM